MAALCTILVFFSEVYGLFGKNVVQPNSLVTAQLGEAVTLPCFHTVDFVSYVSWFKQPLGQQPQLVSIIMNPESGAIFFNKFENSTRFNAMATKGTFNLTVSQVESSDSATYYCAITKFNEINYGDGTTLMVMGSESDSRTTVLQQPVSESVQPGDSVTLQCIVHTKTCAGEHSVYWFRQGAGESPPGMIYTHGNRGDECQRSSGAVSPTQSCVYNFPKSILSLSDAGTYYCAVATCGEILFGNGTKLCVEGGIQGFSSIILMIPCVALAVSLIVNAALLCILRKKNVCVHCAGNTLQKSQHDTTHDSRNQCSSEAVLNYAALSFTEKNLKTRPKRREQKQDPIYAHVRTQDWS